MNFISLSQFTNHTVVPKYRRKLERANAEEREQYTRHNIIAIIQIQSQASKPSFYERPPEELSIHQVLAATVG